MHLYIVQDIRLVKFRKQSHPKLYLVALLIHLEHHIIFIEHFGKLFSQMLFLRSRMNLEPANVFTFLIFTQNHDLNPYEANPFL